MSEVLGLTVAEAAGRIRDGALSAAEYGQAWREAAAGDRLNAYLWTAEGGEEGNGAEGALAGVPIALKDVLATEGVPTTCGSRILEGWRPPYDATVVRRLRAGGVVPLGKTLSLIHI